MNISFVGAGNMAGAIISGLINNGYSPSSLYVFDIDKEKRSSYEKIGVNALVNIGDVAEVGDIIILCVKPNVVTKVLSQLSAVNKDEKKIFVSIAAGTSVECLQNASGEKCKIVRVMPNTPAMVGEGMSVICKNENLNVEEMNMVIDIFKSVGRVMTLDEKLIDAVTAISGSGPAYIFMIMEAMADGGVLCGLPRDTAYELTAQTVLGAAKMLLSEGVHPGELKDRVCSPGGTTIEAVATLESAGVRSAFIDAVLACCEKSKNLSKK